MSHTKGEAASLPFLDLLGRGFLLPSFMPTFQVSLYRPEHKTSIITLTLQFIEGQRRMVKKIPVIYFCMTALTTVVTCTQFKIKPVIWHAISKRHAALIPSTFFYLFLVAVQDTNSRSVFRPTLGSANAHYLSS